MTDLRVDVLVIGSGPGGSIAADSLATRGASVTLIEEGADFKPEDLVPEERWAYPRLYQDSGSRATEDRAIRILQGKSLGGGSTINWMTSLRSPDWVIDHWREKLGLGGLDPEDLAERFARIEKELHVQMATAADVNANNDVLRRGAETLGLSPSLLPRNSSSCTNLGACSLGCPIDAKQTSRVYLERAIEHGGRVLTRTRADKLVLRNGRVVAVKASRLGPLPGSEVTEELTIIPDRVVAAGGAINTPSLLLRSGIRSLAGAGTWLHPVVATLAIHPEPIEGWYGSPQSIAVRDFVRRDDRMGFFLETAPVMPLLGATSFRGIGEKHREVMTRLSHVSALIALNVDGFDDDGGRLVSSLGHHRLRYEWTPRLRESSIEAMKTLARIQLAAGAEKVLTLHSPPLTIRTEADLHAIDSAPFEPNRISMFSAHQMGGCAIGQVVDERGKHLDIENLYVADGSLFPTSLSVNPMLSIYAFASLVADSIDR